MVSSESSEVGVDSCTALRAARCPLLTTDGLLLTVPSFSTGAGRSEPSKVEPTPEHPKAELKVYLPPKAGFVEIHLTNQKTGAPISAMQVALMSTEKPTSPFFSESCYSNKVILIPPDKSLLLHISSDGFHEWNESVGKGKLIHLASGARLKLDVQLEPLQ